MIDHGHTRLGVRVELVYHEQAPGDTMGLEKGIVCHQVDAIIEEPVGRLKISYLDSELVPTAFPTIWHYAGVAGWCFDTEDLLSTWFTCHWHAGAIPESLKGKLGNYLHLARTMAPDPETMKADLEALEHVRCQGTYKTIHEMYAEWSSAIIDRPWVDHIRVQELWQRQGIGTLLYEAGARWMATKGFPLWASSLRSDAALAAWNAMQREGRLPIVELTRSDGKVLPAIDYREAACE